MRRIKTWTATVVPAAAVSAALLSAPTATGAPVHGQAESGVAMSAQAKTCEGSPGTVVTKYRTPVHTGYYGSSTVTKTLAAKTSVRTYYKCVNSYGNVWYEITGKMDQDTSKSRFIYSGNLMP